MTTDLDFTIIDPARPDSPLSEKRLAQTLSLAPGQKAVLVRLAGSALVFPLDPARSIADTARDAALAIIGVVGARPLEPGVPASTVEDPAMVSAAAKLRNQGDVFSTE